MTKRLLPPGSTNQEVALEHPQGRVDAIPVPLDTLFDPRRCPETHLPWLAWALSVDVWDDAWSAPAKRQVIAESIRVHRLKGTVGSVKRAIAAAIGQTPTIIEGLHRPRRDGSCRRNAHYFRGWPQAWALYRAVLSRPVTNRQAQAVRAILSVTAPARSRLLSLDFRAAALLRDGSGSRNNAYNRGVA